MPIKPAGLYAQQTGVTSGTAAADRTILLQPSMPASFMLDLTAGSPATGAKLEVTTDSYDAINAGTATWVTPDNTTNTLVDKVLTSTAPSGCMLTGARITVTDGTWTFGVRQGI